MENVLTLRPTHQATRWLANHRALHDKVLQALLAGAEGHRHVVELESFARALGLDPRALDRLRRDGLMAPDVPSSSNGRGGVATRWHEERNA